MRESTVTIESGKTTAEQGGRTSSARGALASLSLSMLLSSLGTSIANVALPTLAQAFDASFQEIQWVVLAYLLAITTLIVSVGRLGDILGHKRLLLAGLLLFAAASVLCGATTTLWLLIVARGLQGLGAAIMMALSLAMVGGTVAKEKIGSAMGLLGTMSAIGTALGPTLGGVLISSVGWRAIFIVNAVAAILTLYFTYRFLPADRLKHEIDKPGIDVTGTLLLALTLAAYALAMTLGGSKLGLYNLALIVSSAVGVSLFIFVEKKVKAPLLDLAMFRDTLLNAGLITSAFVSTVLMATLVVGPFYLTYSLGLEAGLVGLVLSVGPIVVALSGMPAGRLVDKVGSQSLTVIGLIGIAMGALILSLMPISYGVSGFIGAIIIITTGYALFQTANNTAVMKDTSIDKRGVVSGMLNLSRNLGLITGASLMGAVFSLAAGTSDITTAKPEEVATGMRVTFVVAAVLIVFAVFIAVTSRALAAKKSSMDDKVTELLS